MTNNQIIFTIIKLCKLVEVLVMSDVKIETVSPADAERLLEIYTPYIKNTAITFEYDVPSVEKFRERIENTLVSYPYLKAVCNGKIIGYAYLSRFRERKAYQFCAETSIYVDTEERAKGTGSLLYKAIEELAKKQGILNLNACITYSNPPSIAFHEKLGYKTIGHFSKCGYKFGKWYDMIWMEKFIGEHSDTPKEFIPFSELNK